MDEQNIKMIKRNIVLLIIFILVLIGGIGLSIKRIGDNIKEPFIFSKTGSGETNASSYDEPDDNQEILRVVRLKTTDTDNDGLSDYDETYIYNTSIYLEDSDSDGINDQKEIEANSDPNCPKGQNCFNPGLEVSEEPVPTYQDLPGATGQSPEERVLAGQATPDEIREFLKQGGMAQEDLDKLTDEMVLELYAETLESVDASAGSPDSGSTAEVNVGDVKSYIESLSTDELKNLLKESGVTDEMLDKIDTETMRQLFLESLNQ